MPSRAPSRCTLCSAIATSRGRCADHQRVAWENPSANTRTLTRRERQEFHDAVLEADDYTCRRCGGPATQADHIIPIADGGAHDLSNGRALCDQCHDEVSIEQRRARIARAAARAASA